MKTLAGLQLQNRKASKDPIKTQRDNDVSKAKENAVMTTNMQPATKPSRPSIKFVKFMTAVKEITNKINKRKKSKEPGNKTDQLC